ncbi:hypothetical protein SAMN05444161_3561 [Rhizobiales bacterium GAS191]|nr:hypothetical protein SAMN05444161_3561 [Rhizobiales bacterium GAS191]
MTRVRKFLTPEKLDEYLSEETGELLRDARIWKFSSYGWQDADTPDPEFIGHAVWQLRRAGEFEEIDWNSSAEAQPQKVPEWRRIVTIQGADLEGLMELARQSIGLVLFYSTARQFPFADQTYFELHWINSILHLSMCSDRLREIFVAVVFKKSSDDYSKEGKTPGGKRKTWYVTPFEEAGRSVNNPSAAVSEALNKLQPYAKEISDNKQARNETVHEVATALAKWERDRLQRRKPAHMLSPKRLTTQDWKQRQQRIEAAHARSVADSISILTSWYLLLARAANEVFVLEHHLRSDT